jgi:hypothetical protein
MAIEKYLSTQGAILIAGALIAGGLFFGLRGRDPAPPGAPAVSLHSSPPAELPAVLAPEAPVLPPGPRGAPSPALDRAAVVEAAAKALERARAAVVASCVAPSLAKKPAPPQVKLVFSVAFDAEGKQIGRGISEDRATSRPEVTQCVTDKLPALQIPPPGAPVQVDVPWTLP